MPNLLRFVSDMFYKILYNVNKGHDDCAYALNVHRVMYNNSYTNSLTSQTHTHTHRIKKVYTKTQKCLKRSERNILFVFVNVPVSVGMCFCAFLLRKTYNVYISAPQCINIYVLFLP